MRLILILKFIFLVSLADSIFGQQSCPSKCRCDRKVVRCIHQAMETIPNAPNDTQILDLRFNVITAIPADELSQLPSLRSLLLNNNQVTELRSGAFRGLHNLLYLYLYHNRIQHIDPDVFEDMVLLKQLYLQTNEITTIAPETFSNLPNLESLYLHNNHIKTIPQGSFSGTTQIQRLRLDSNALLCDCALAWLPRMAREHVGMQLAATCAGPPRAAGAALQAMLDEDFHCRIPEIMAEPTDTTINFGGDAMFSCVVAGDPAPEVVWLYDSNQILDNQRYHVMGNGTLMVHNADQYDAGYFECMAKNTLGETRSKPVRILFRDNATDTGKLVFSVIPREQTTRPGALSVRFDCQAGGHPKPYLIWLFNNERILIDDKISLSKNGSLTIKNVQNSDAGLYTCQAQNINAKITASAALNILVAPHFTSEPQNQSVTIGDRVELRCAADGAPAPRLSWRRHTQALAPGDNILLTDNNQNLTIVEATFDDEAIYYCRAENSDGFVETSATVSVKDFQATPPKIILKPEATEAYRETTVQLPCEVESEAPVDIEWRKDGSRIIPNERISITLIGSLVIYNLTLLDTGSYECSVFNEYGRDTSSAILTIKDKILPGEEYINRALVEAARDVDQAIFKTMEQLFKNNSNSADIHQMFRISRYPNAPARDIARAAEVYERALYKVREFVKSGVHTNSSEPFSYLDILSPKHLDVIARLSGCTAHRARDNCSDTCYHQRYRNIDGTCNNYQHTFWGSSLTGFRRILPPIYENGFSQPVGWNKDVTYNGYKLPSARLVSTKIITTKNISQDVDITHMTMQWGQWLDHDLDHELPSVSSQTWDGVDCKKTCQYAAPCFPIEVPDNDPRIKDRRCIDFIRTSSVCGSGETSVLFGKLQPREQINQLTSYIDASQVYGFDKLIAEDLREFTNDQGLLRVGAKFPGRKPLLPNNGINGMDCRRNLSESVHNCFVAGDIRANEQVGLMAMHTIWMREHNRVATELKQINPFWDGNKTYEEARKIVGAEMQIITYEHWLPLIVGREGYEMLGTYNGYNSNINPSISNVFAAAALRFGHSLINPVLHRYDEHFETIPQGHLMLRHAFFSPWRLVDEGGVDPLLRGMFTTPAKLKTPKQNLNSELTERLFEATHAVALDLAAINIQRGRDHAIPPYYKWREFCNMTEVHTFDDLKNEITDEQVRDKLRELYGSPLNIDVWVGGILEDQVEGGKVGPLFRCLLLEQFKRLRDGDRFWYENPSIFKPEQVRELKKTSLSRVLCDNGDNIDTISENVFLLAGSEGLVACEDVAGADLHYWADCEDCAGDEGSGRRARRAAPALTNLLQSHYDLERTIGDLTKRLETLEKNMTCIKNTKNITLAGN